MRKIIPLNINLNNLQKIFNNISIDKYFLDGYRYKEIIRYKKLKNTFFETPHSPMYASEKHNPIHGGIIRKYNKITSCNELEQIVNRFYKETNLNDCEVLVQAQRILCKNNKEYYPTIEGIHQDGTKYMSIFCVNRENISGGISQIFTSNNPKDLCYEYEMKPNDMLILDDEKYWHYVTPIQKKQR